jgi:PAS domain S-box-containing protein
MLRRHWTLQTLKPRIAVAAATLLAAVIAITLFSAPVTLQVSIAFALPVLLCAWTRNRRFLWTLTVCVIATTLVRVIFSSDKPHQALGYFYANRCISLVTTFACACVAHMLIGLIESLEAEHARLWTVLNTVPVGVSIADLQSNTIMYNEQAGKMLGVEPDRLYDLGEMTEKFAQTQQGQETERRRHGISRALQGELVTGLERDFLFPDGRRLDVLVSAAPMRDRSGRIVGAVSGFVDITEQKAMQEALDGQRQHAEEQSLRKSKFLAAVSHDIRTPANAINLLAELIERSAGSADLAADLPETARDLKLSAMSLVRLVSDVLDITRYDQGKVELSTSDFPLADLLHDECRQFAQQAKDKGIDFVCNPPPPSLVIRSDRVKLSRVVDNLVGNAVKFTRQGRITLEAMQEDGHVYIQVVDTGPGIPPEHHQQIFDEYFQIKNPQREHEKGSGLGLAICKRLAQALEAELKLQSAPGQGTTFTVTLPGKCVVQC